MLAFAVVACVLTAAACAEDEEAASDVSAGAAVGVLSHYASRGAVISNEPVVQAEGWVSWNGWTLDTWSNVDLTDDNVAPLRLTETDWAVSYGFSIEPVAVEIGYIYYTFPNFHVEDTEEAFVTLGLDWVVSPELTTYWDFDEVGGTYTSFALSHCTPLPWQSAGQDVSLAVSGAVGYGDSNYVAGCFDDVGSSFVDLVLGVEVTVPLSEHASLVPSLSYMQVLDGELRECTENSEALYGGVSLVVEY